MHGSELTIYLFIFFVSWPLFLALYSQSHLFQLNSVIYFILLLFFASFIILEWE